jgi:hypothetical protein
MDHNYEKMIEYRLKQQNLDTSSAGVIAAGLAAIVVHTFTEMINQQSSDDFAAKLEDALLNFKFVGLAGLKQR